MPCCARWNSDSCAPEDFYSTTNHRTHVRQGQKWIEVENQRMDAMIVVRDGRANCRRLRDLRRGDRDRGGAARHPRDSRIQGARPAVVRVHVQRHLFGAAGGNGRPPDRGSGAPRHRAEAESDRGGGTGSGAHRRGSRAGRARPQWIRFTRCWQRQRPGRARCGGRAVRHLAGRAALRRPPGRARPPQSHARHQRDLSRRFGARRRSNRDACGPASCTSA